MLNTISLSWELEEGGWVFYEVLYEKYTVLVWFGLSCARSDITWENDMFTDTLPDHLCRKYSNYFGHGNNIDQLWPIFGLPSTTILQSIHPSSNFSTLWNMLYLLSTWLWSLWNLDLLLGPQLLDPSLSDQGWVYPLMSAIIHGVVQFSKHHFVYFENFSEENLNKYKVLA